MDVDDTATSPSRKVAKTDTSTDSTPDSKKSDRKSDGEDPKPRIVLTFRSDKRGTKTSNMKIVTTEEKQGEHTALRRSGRSNRCTKPFLDINASTQTMDTFAGPSRSRKRSARRSSTDLDVVANAIARKEKSYNETLAPSRPVRVIKPTAKVLANEELMKECKKEDDDEGVSTRRSVRKTTRNTKDLRKEESDDEVDNSNQVMKLQHLCKLGLKAIGPDDSQTSKDVSDSNEDEPIEIDDDEDEEIDDDTEVISKLLEDDDNSGVESETSEGRSVAINRPRRKVRDEPVKKGIKSFCGKLPYQPSVDPQLQEYLDSVPETYYIANGLPVYSRPLPARPEHDDDDISLASAAETGAEAVRPGDTDENTLIGKCFCEAPSNVYADPTELTEPVFCQGIELIDGARVGCCHPAWRCAGALAPLLSAGPRAPFTLLCKRHTAQMRRHMCCSTCGVFCTQGTFYRCPLGHLFHIECALGEAGCPHCGTHCYRWEPARRAVRVRVRMLGERTVFVPRQREQCKPAFLSFTHLPTPLEDTPALPEGLLPSPPVDLKQLCSRAVKPGEVTTNEALCEAILAGESAEMLVPKIMSCPDLSGCAHTAAGAGAVTALYLLQYARVDLDAQDAHSRTPLMVAIDALLDKKPENTKKSKNVSVIDESKTKDESEIEDVNMEPPIETSGTNKPSEDDLKKVVKYLIAAGCDLDAAGSDGMTALHQCSAHGGDGGGWAAARLLAAGASVDCMDHGGWTPLVWAAENDHQDVLRLLISYGAEPMSVDTEGNSAVHWCALAGASRALPALLDAAPNAHSAPNAHNDTPLHIAARQGHYACVVILLARGARTDVENSAGELPVEVCSGQCQTVVSLNMQMTLALRNNTIKRNKLLCSDISRGREPHPIPVVNEIDDAPIPVFSYVTAYVYPQTILVDNSMGTMQGCECLSSCGNGGAECACGVLSVRRWWRGGRLARGFPHHDPPMLFECNATCACDTRKCGNNILTRLLQTGSVWIRVEVFRCSGNRGWGLRSTRRVRRGTPLAAYCGEVLLPAAVEARADDSYMFALDVKQDLLEQCAVAEQLCVDAAMFGGAARFVNHSCRPAAAPVRAHTLTRDLRLPNVALFAIRDIEAGEEITFDYGDKFWSVKNKTMACECGEPECRYPSIKSEEAET